MTFTPARAQGVGHRREAVSVICVYSDTEVRRRCLDRSIAERAEGVEIEYLPVDNTEGAFETAGAALNHGASLATNDYLVFVHQDVYLRSLRALERAAGALADDPTIGVLGAAGITRDGDIVGRVRDRVVLIGKEADEPVDVDSVDEMLFMAPRSLIEREPLSEEPELAWHAYALELGVRARSLGLRVCALDIPLTHNSMTTNLDRLDTAYAAVASRHPQATPVRATCGWVRPDVPARPGSAMLRPHRWRYRWLRESLAAHVARSAAGARRCVLGDIRLDVDEVIASDLGQPLLVINLDRGRAFADEDPLELIRGTTRITLRAQPLSGMIQNLAGAEPSKPVLLTNLDREDLEALAPHLPRGPRLLGFRREIGYWLLLGQAAASTAPPSWRTPKARPLAMPALG
jgi:Glycosyltransferase like family